LDIQAKIWSGFYKRKKREDLLNICLSAGCSSVFDKKVLFSLIKYLFLP